MKVELEDLVVMISLVKAKARGLHMGTLLLIEDEAQMEDNPSYEIEAAPQQQLTK